MSTIAEINHFRRSVLTNVFDYKIRDQTEPTKKRQYRKERLKKTKDMSLLDRWLIVKSELTEDFQKNGNATFINGFRRKKKNGKKRKSTKMPKLP